MGEQWLRSARLVVDTIEVAELRMTFDVVKSLDKQPNTAELTIYNLNQAHRDQLQQVGKPVFRLEVGYGGDYGQLFYAKAREVYSYKEGADWLTVVGSGDGNEEVKRARINKSFAKGTNVASVLTALAQSLKVELGTSLLELQRSGKLLDAAGQFSAGTVASGNSAKEMTKILRGVGKEWSIQDGVLQLLDIGQVLQGLAVVISDETGMVDSPTLGSDGILRVKTLLNPAIVPGRQIQVKARSLPEAAYKVHRIHCTGDTSAGPWYTEIEATVLA